MLRFVIALAVIAALIAIGVNTFVGHESKKGPNTITITVPNPGGQSGGGGGDQIYVP